MKIKSILVAFLAVIFLTLSCSKDDSSAQATQVTGTIAGKLMVKNGSKPVGGALVFVFDDNNKIYYTHTQANGDFSLQAPIGQRKLQMQTGNGTNFRTSLQVTVIKDQTITIDPALSRLDQVASMAYVSGSYDEIQDIVTALGYTITQITNADLADYSKVSLYDIIFLNCGAKQNNTAINATIDTNLADFVTNGGSLYASDWAVAYLTGGATNSHACGEAGGFIPDDKLCSKNIGASGTITGAQVTDANLATALGFSSLDIEYDLGIWQNIFSYDATYWDVMVSDPATSQPLMIKTTSFSTGTVSTPVGGDNDDGWITICHTDDSGAQITVTIEESDWAAHEAHGDAVGACTNTNDSGTIYYTSFHNHADENIGNSGLILEYVILNL
jgi:hypothetical protein